MTGNDRDLFEAFAALRQEEETRVLPFAAGANAPFRHGRTPSSRTLAVATACLATLIAGAVWLSVPHQRQSPPQPPISIASWRPSTDFLLDTPGHELLHGVPAIGEFHPPALPRNLHPKPRQPR